MDTWKYMIVSFLISSLIFNPLGQRYNRLMASLFIHDTLCTVSSHISETVHDLFSKYCVDVY